MDLDLTLRTPRGCVGSASHDVNPPSVLSPHVLTTGAVQPSPARLALAGIGGHTPSVGALVSAQR